MAAVYVIEDDAAIRAAIAETLAARGHFVETSATGLDAVGPMLELGPDVVVLDLGLPDIDGAVLLGMIRGVSDVPVIVATARDDEREIIRLLDAGADDYLVKPFSADQLEARVRAVIRRTRSGTGNKPIRIGDLVIDPGARRVLFGGRELDLTRKEFDLLALLASRAGEVVEREELLAEVWRQPFGGSDKTIDVHVSWLRRKLGEDASNPRYIHTVRGVGLRLNDPMASP